MSQLNDNINITEAKREVRRLVKISGSYYISVPPEFVRTHGLEVGEGLLVQIGKVLTISPIPKGDVLLPKEEILLPYPEDIDTSDEVRLSVTAFTRNYQRINDYVKYERPDWELLEVTMETVERDKQRFFKVNKIINKSTTVEK